MAGARGRSVFKRGPTSYQKFLENENDKNKFEHRFETFEKDLLLYSIIYNKQHVY